MLSKDTAYLEDDAQTETSQCYLDAISDKSEQSITAWYIRAMMNNNKVVFKVDIGAEVTAISKEAYYHSLSMKFEGYNNMAPIKQQPTV